ncbi:Oidioi.mRNA.OKI2018_I69.PAR.g10912.t1.cds [Oikopleura dioica]|uniref:Oidioi.mRNA.OKI2018_I69.PAR.g10912.t1.cds n=1 Tax=Oikopleura dioica TaxID=34765 RepID=A0ABN7RXH5_OIKDI|nr:Oidioi.mRNA.OKI2018_I69.PAR.g10912.t1.cds [Oikopleura dioica]
MVEFENDPCCFSDITKIRTKSIHFDWTIDYSLKQVKGSAELTCDVLEEGLCTFMLDTRELDVQKVLIEGNEMKFSFGQAGQNGKSEALGKPLIIVLPDVPPPKGEDLVVKIFYNTTEKCSALQWLTKEQTAGGEHPYMFSQCQAIHARSLFPCQDSPGVKIKYTAKVSVAAPLVALMSANLQHDKTEKTDSVNTFYFSQHVPMPSYLVAIASGALESREIGPRSRVWSEKEFVDKAAFEFSQTEDFIKAGESLLGPYVWGQYDLLVLPPSFPYGGMENPCLTFVTPTLLAGDKSLANVVAHEIAHSWTGNLVTNVNWQHFWLNEGHTVFVERKIVEKIYNRPTAEFQAIGGWTGLVETVDTLGAEHEYTKLVIKNDGSVDPDDSFSRIPYEKGFSLLYHLQSLVGIPKFEGFLKAYIEAFSYKALDTQQWKDLLFKHFSGSEEDTAILNKVDWDAWFNNTGMPPVPKPQYDTSLQDVCTALAKKWRAGDGAPSADDIASFNSGQLQEFLDQLVLDSSFSPEQVQQMSDVYKGISESHNSEVRFRWIHLGLKSRFKPAIDNALAMVTEQGRMKFTRPLYRDLKNWDLALPRAVETFKKNRPSMHPTTAALVAKDLGLQ